MGFPTPKPDRRFTVLFFDLDDTLLDTNGQLVAPAAREACAAMIGAGLDADLEPCLRERQRLAAERPREDIHLLLARQFGIRPDSGATFQSVRNVGYRAYFFREILPGITTFPGVYDLLDYLGRRYRLHLVTSGGPPTQRKKVAFLGLEPYFHGVHYVDTLAGEKKGSVFAELMHSEAAFPGQCFCVGDRVDREIREGKKLGMVTCHVHHGEFAGITPQTPEEMADYRIEHISALVPTCKL